MKRWWYCFILVIKEKKTKRDKEKCQKSEIKRNKRRIFTSTVEP